MGYSTDFTGTFKFNSPLDPQTREFLLKLNRTRRMKRNLPPKYGVEGEFFVDGAGFAGQDKESSIVDYNDPPSTQPGLWCQWRPNIEGTHLEWDGNEKFYSYIPWLKYIVEKILAPCGYSISGTVFWQGEDPNDTGNIWVKDNVITFKANDRSRSQED